MIGAVGGDGEDMIKELKTQDVHTEDIKVIDLESTGNAMILIEEKTGENRSMKPFQTFDIFSTCYILCTELTQDIVILSPGTNHRLKPANFTRAENLGSPWPDLLVMQLEIPLDTVMQILETAKAAGVDVLLNPAPAIKLEDEAYEAVTHLSIYFRFLTQPQTYLHTEPSLLTMHD